MRDEDHAVVEQQIDERRESNCSEVVTVREDSIFLSLRPRRRVLHKS